MSTTTKLQEVMPACPRTVEQLERDIHELDKRINPDKYEARARRSLLEAMADTPIPGPSQKQLHDAGLSEKERDWLQLLHQAKSKDNIADVLRRCEALLINQFDRDGILVDPATMTTEALCRHSLLAATEAIGR